MVARAPPGPVSCPCAPGRARRWETRRSSWRDREQPLRAPLAEATRGALTLHHPSPFLPRERRRCRAPSVGRPGLHWGGVAVDCVGANRGARALIGFAVLERGLKALRGSTLPLDPQGLIVLFLRVCPRSR